MMTKKRWIQMYKTEKNPEVFLKSFKSLLKIHAKRKHF